MDKPKPPTGHQELSKAVTDRIEEVKQQTEIVAYKGPPGMATANKTRDKHRQKLICYLKAIGMKNKDIANSIGGTSEEVSRVIKAESAIAEIDRIQHEIFVAQPAKMFESILPQAVRIAVDAMMSKKTKTSVRVDAAFKFMDRALGKPSQQVEVSHNLLKDLIQKMDSSGTSQAIEADFDLIDTEEAKEKK
jgi:hypothetical protein